MRSSSICWLGLLGLALSGCSKEPEPTFSAPLLQQEPERLGLIVAHDAQPVLVDGFSQVYVQGGIERKNCSRCHQAGQEPYRDESLAPGQDAHWDVELHHAGDMDCFSCHRKENPEMLVSVLNKNATLDTAYLHCGSCHEQQFESWLGGAHGKRVTGWNGVRIIKNCTACHDPHAPSRETVIPVAQPTIAPERMRGH